MLPLLAYLANGTIRRTVPEVTDHLAAHFHLTQDDLDQRLPSGVQPTFYNRTHWAVTYMAKAGLITRPARGQIVITPRGKDVVASRPERVDVAYLRRYPEFEEFRTKTRDARSHADRPDAAARSRAEPRGTPVRDVRVAPTGR